MLSEVANAVADWVGFVAEAANCPCSRPWLQTELDPWAWPQPTGPAALAVGAADAFELAASVVAEAALGPVAGLSLQPLSTVLDGKLVSLAIKPG